MATNEDVSGRQRRAKMRRKRIEVVQQKRQVIAIIIGSGDLPVRILGQLERLKLEHIPISIKGFGPPQFESFEIGKIGAILRYIKSKNATEVIFCGGIKRPSLLSLKLDSVGKKWLANLGIRAFFGDDVLLRGLKKLVEKEGLKVISPQSILNTLLTTQGILTDCKPSQRDLQDIARGLFVLNALSKADVGQSIVVQEGIVLGIEAAEGTRELIRRCRFLRLSEEGGVLVKTSKTNQDVSIDLPTIGPNTILEAAESFLAGIALGAGKSQIIDYEATVSLANQKGIFVIGV